MTNDTDQMTVVMMHKIHKRYLVQECTVHWERWHRVLSYT